MPNVSGANLRRGHFRSIYGFCGYSLVFSDASQPARKQNWLKITNFSYSTLILTPSLRMNPFKFLDELFYPESRVHGLSVGEDFVMHRFDSVPTCDRRTDTGQTGGRTSRP